MVKDDDDGQTVLMLAASTGSPDVLELVASRLPRAQVSGSAIVSSSCPLVECKARLAFKESNPD